MKLVLQVALGIILAGVIIFLLKIAFVAVFITAATSQTEKIQEKMQAVGDSVKERSEQISKELRLENDRRKAAQSRLDERKRLDRIKTSSIVVTSNGERIVRHTGEGTLNSITPPSFNAHYKKHWSKFYKESEECAYPSSAASMVECVDAKKKAKENFDMLYKSGHFKGR